MPREPVKREQPAILATEGHMLHGRRWQLAWTFVLAVIDAAITFVFSPALAEFLFQMIGFVFLLYVFAELSRPIPG